MHVTEMFLRRHYWEKWKKFRTYIITSILCVCAMFKYIRDPATYDAPEQLNNYVRFEENYTCSSSLELRDLYDTVERLNAEREVLNWAAFGPVLVDTTVLAVCAGRDAERLQYLIASLARVDSIRSTIIVFSHSFYDERVNQLIKSITFCMVMQVYFPNSVQLFRNVFPGEEASECANATDTDGELCSERDAHRAEAKHHWWWTAHLVFEDLPWAHIHAGMVMFLEEDDYVLPDLLHMLRYARSSLASIPEAQILAFGRPLAQRLDHDKLTVDSWRPPYDRGLTFNKTLWMEIKRLEDHFCGYDDASWSYSLQHALEKSRHGRVVMVACMAPRVISTGIYKSGRRAIENIYGLTRSSALFPEKVKAISLYGRKGPIYRHFKASPGNGGWRDLRDHLLCLDPLTSTATNENDIVTSMK